MDRLITYAITVCNEHEELETLLLQLEVGLGEQTDWHILVQNDDGNTTPEVIAVIRKYAEKFGPGKFTSVSYPLDMDFARYKNNLRRFARGKWIFQIDADETLRSNLLYGLHKLLSSPDQEDLDVVLLSRINVVKDIAEEDIRNWHWNVRSDVPGVNHPVINWPDMQYRIYRNHPVIQWKNKVHEILTGHKTLAKLCHPDWSLVHVKGIERQRAQNAFYSKIIEKQLNID